MEEHEFNRLGLRKRLKMVEAKGTYIASRFMHSYYVHLFALEGFHVEVYYKLGYDIIHFVDIQKNRDVLSEYVEQFDYEKHLGFKI